MASHQTTPTPRPLTGLLDVLVLLNDNDDGVHNGLLVLHTSLLSQHGREERHQDVVLTGELDTHRLDGLHHDGLELIGDLRHEAGDLFHKAFHTRLTAGLCVCVCMCVSECECVCV